MSKKIIVQELFDGLDMQLDVKAYDQLDRTSPALADAIADLVRAGQTPEMITSHVFGKYPHLWVEAQTIRAAARHLRRELG